jgi:adenosine deaminase
MNASSADYRRLPKIDLHRHLEGALRLDTLWEFHQKQNQGLHASREDLQHAYTLAPGEIPGFAPFLGKFTALFFKFGGLQEIERVGREAVEDAANDGIIHLELRFSPVGFARRTLLSWNDPPQTNIDQQLVVDAAAALIQGATSEAARHNMSVSFIVTLGRHFGLDINRPAADLLAHSVAKDLVGLDLAGDEAVSASEYIPHFCQWAGSGRGATVHAGEDPRGDRGPANIREAIHHLRADRIGHGIRAVEDASLLDDLKKRKTVLEVCITSNLQTQAAPSYASHPIRKLIDAGVRTTINSDDPVLSGITLSDEFAVARNQCGLSHDDLLKCSLIAAEAAYVPMERKFRLRDAIVEAWKDPR